MIKIYKRDFNKNNNIFLLMSSLLAAYFFTERIYNYTILNKGQYVITFIYLILIFFGLFYFNSKICRKIVDEKLNVSIVKIGVLLVTFIVIISFKTYFFNFNKTATIDILATGEKNIKSNASEVWITRVIIDNEKYDVSNINLENGWELKDGSIVSYKNQPKNIKMNFKCKNEVKIYFLKHPWSGIVKVIDKDSESTIDLFSEKACDYEYIIKASQVKLNPLKLSILFIGIGIILYNLFLFMVALNCNNKCNT